MKKEMTVTQALAELKMLGKRIDDAITGFNPVGVSVGNNNAVQGYKSNDEFKTSVQSKWDQINQLIRNRINLKAAVVHSNSRTEVVIGEEKMTVAAAIERKDSIEHEKALLLRMKQIFQLQSTVYEKNIQNLATKKEEIIKNYSATAEKTDEVTKNLLNSQIALIESVHTPAFHDPLDIKKEIEKLEKKINDFETNVDYVLSVSNATTMIEIEV